MTKTKYAPGLSGTGTIARARAWVGRKFSPGWCLYWCLTQVYKVPGLGDYDHDGAADAEDYWKAAKKRGTVVETSDPKKIPAGALIMWTGGSGDHGHAAVSLGDGQMISTDLPTRGKVGECPIDLPRSRWGHKLVGYVEVDGNGFTLRREPVEPPPAPKPDVYRVTTPAGLNIRSGPSTRSKVLGLAKKGTKVTAVKVVTGDSREWVVDSKKRHFARQYLERVQ